MHIYIYIYIYIYRPRPATQSAAPSAAAPAAAVALRGFSPATRRLSTQHVVVQAPGAESAPVRYVLLGSSTAAAHALHLRGQHEGRRAEAVKPRACSPAVQLASAERGQGGSTTPGRPGPCIVVPAPGAWRSSSRHRSVLRVAQGAAAPLLSARGRQAARSLVAPTSAARDASSASSTRTLPPGPEAPPGAPPPLATVVRPRSGWAPAPPDDTKCPSPAEAYQTASTVPSTSDLLKVVERAAAARSADEDLLLTLT